MMQPITTPSPGGGTHPQNPLPVGCFHARVMLQWTRLGTLPYGCVENSLGLVLRSRTAGLRGTVPGAGLSQLASAQPGSPLVWHQSASDISRSHKANVISRHFRSPLRYSPVRTPILSWGTLHGVTSSVSSTCFLSGAPSS